MPSFPLTGTHAPHTMALWHSKPELRRRVAGEEEQGRKSRLCWRTVVKSSYHRDIFFSFKWKYHQCCLIPLYLCGIWFVRPCGEQNLLGNGAWFVGLVGGGKVDQESLGICFQGIKLHQVWVNPAEQTAWVCCGRSPREIFLHLVVRQAGFAGKLDMVFSWKHLSKGHRSFPFQGHWSSSRSAVTARRVQWFWGHSGAHGVGVAGAML